MTRKFPFVPASLLLLFFFCFPASDATGKMYKWKDETGNWHFTDSIKKIPEKFRTPEMKPKPPQKIDTTSIPVPIFISKDGFKPVVMKTAASSNNSIPLTGKPPKGIKVHPRYQGSRQKFGRLQLGTRTNNAFYFALDLIPGGHPEMYFDANQNGDLSDDRGPLVNQGNGIFATRLRIPFKNLLKEDQLPGDYRAWFYTNQGLWKKQRVTFYSQTQLEGQVTMGGKEYTAYLVDVNINDADYTNDGIHIDIDGDGKIVREAEYFQPHEWVNIDGRNYEFIITW